MTISGTAGNDALTGTTGDDVFNMTQGGTDTVHGLGGNDTFSFGAALRAGDVVDGGNGTDTLKLDGDYSGAHQLVFTSTTLVSIDKMVLAGGHSYALTMDDGNLAAGQSMTITAGALTASDVLNFSAALEQDGAYHIAGGAGADIIGGGHGDDHIAAGGGGDSINGGLGGHDVLDGGDGNDFIGVNGGSAAVTGGSGGDILTLNAAWSASDRLDGGDGNDILTLAHGGTIHFGTASLTGIEEIFLNAGQTYSLKMNDANVAAGQSLSISGANLTTGLTFDGAGELNGSFSIVTGAGNDDIDGSQGDDVIDPGSGSDNIEAGHGNDLILMGDNLDVTDRIDGGDGLQNEVQVSGDYSAGLVFGAHTMEYIDYFVMGAGHSYKFTTNDENVENGRIMHVDASALGAADTVSFNGSHETDCSFVMTAGIGNATFIGGAKADTFNLGNGNTLATPGIDSIKGEAGNDIVTITNAFDVHSHIDGGDGNDTVNFEVSSNTAFHFNNATLTSVETLDIKNVTFAAIVMRDANLDANETMLVDGSSISGAIGGVTNHFSFDGSAETDGNFLIEGGNGNDTLTGGANADNIEGGLGADLLTGNGGVDRFVYAGANDSKGGLGTYDTVVGFDAGAEKFLLNFVVTGVDAAVTTGALNAATFTTDMATALGASHLAAGHATLFTANSGDLAGHTFLVVDVHGSAGYAANDYVIELQAGVNLANLAVSDFA